MAESPREYSSRPFLGFGTNPPSAQSTAHAAPTELGKLLCATRMRVGKDLQRIADVLHIRYNYLVAIEDGRYEDLPGQAYAIGFVRAYADHLGLDGDEIVRRYKEESAGVRHKTAFELQMPSADSALPSGTLLLVAVVAGMLIYGVWYAMAGSDRSAVELIQEVPDRLAAIADATTIEAASPVTAPPRPETTAPDGADLAAEPDSAQPASPTAGPAQESVAAALPQPAQTVPPPAAAPPLVSDVLELRAKADVWITLRDSKGTERTQFLRKEEVLRLAEQGITTLVTANASDLEILVNGKSLPPLDAGLFARGVALDPQKLKNAAPGPAAGSGPPANAPALPAAATPPPAAASQAPASPAATSPPPASPTTPAPAKEVPAPSPGSPAGAPPTGL